MSQASHSACRSHPFTLRDADENTGGRNSSHTVSGTSNAEKPASVGRETARASGNRRRAALPSYVRRCLSSSPPRSQDAGDDDDTVCRLAIQLVTVAVVDCSEWSIGMAGASVTALLCTPRDLSSPPPPTRAHDGSEGLRCRGACRDGRCRQESESIAAHSGTPPDSSQTMQRVGCCVDQESSGVKRRLAGTAEGDVCWQ